MGGARPVPRPHPQNRKRPSEVRLSYPAAPPTREGMSGNSYLGPARPSGYITITWSGRRAYHKYRTLGFPGPVQDRVPSSPVEMEFPAPDMPSDPPFAGWARISNVKSADPLNQGNTSICGKYAKILESDVIIG